MDCGVIPGLGGCLPRLPGMQTKPPMILMNMAQARTGPDTTICDCRIDGIVLHPSLGLGNSLQTQMLQENAN